MRPVVLMDLLGPMQSHTLHFHGRQVFVLIHLLLYPKQIYVHWNLNRLQHIYLCVCVCVLNI